MKRFFSLIFLMAITTYIAKGQESYTFTLEQCLDYAFRNNYNRQSIELSKEAKDDMYKQSKMERLPDLNATLSEGFSNNTVTNSSWSGTYNLNTSLPIYQGGSISNTIEQNKLTLEQADYQTKQYDNQLTIQILQAFLTVLGNEELLNSQESVLQFSEEQVKLGKEQYRVGKILESDYLLLEAQYATDYSNIVDTRISRDNSLLTLKSLLSMNPSNKLSIIYPDTTAFSKMAVLPPLDSVIKQSMSSLPDLKISDYNVEIAKIGVKLSKSAYYPSLNLSAGLSTGHMKDYSQFGNQLSDNFTEQVGLNLTIPIYNKNRTKSKVTQSKIQLQQSELDKMQTELTMLQDVTQEYQNVVSTFNKYQASDIKQNAYYKSFEAYNAQFNLGSITAVELLQQQNNYISALNDYIQNKYGFMLQRKVLDVYMGKAISF